MVTSKKSLIIVLLLIVMAAVDHTEGKNATKRKHRRFCPAVQGKKRPPILNVQASLQTTKGKAIFRVKTCRDPPVCFLATTSGTSPYSAEHALWQTLLDAFMGKLDIEPTFISSVPYQANDVSKVIRPTKLPFFQIPGNIIVMYPVLEKLCKDSYGVYSFVQLKNKTRPRSSMFTKTHTIAQLLSKVSTNKTRTSKKTTRRPRAHLGKSSLQQLFFKCASCSRICVQDNETVNNGKRFLCSTIRINCSFRCGDLERLMKNQRIKRNP